MGKAVAKSVEATAPAHTSGVEIAPLIERIMTDPSIPIDRVEQAFSFYQKVQADEARKAFTEAMVSAQAEMEPIRKDAYNPQTKSKYASFDALDRAARPIYSKHGFAPTYRTEPSDKPDHIKVILTLMHRAGHERDYPMDIPADGKGAKGGDVMTKTHAAGSALSYGKRYTLGGAFNLITTERDDDGNAAGGGGMASDNQIAELKQLIADTNVDIGWICGRYSVEGLSDLTQKQISECKAGLAARKRKMEAAR